MPKKIYNNLTALKVKNLSKVGRHSDGQGLYLQISKTGSKSWIFIFRDSSTKKLKEMGLGSIVDISLAKAREKAAAARELLQAGKNPIIERKIEKEKISSAKTFNEFGRQCIDDWAKRWKNPKTLAKWNRLLNDYASEFKDYNFEQIDANRIYLCLKKIWNLKPIAAREAQQGLEKIFDAAKVARLYAGENPARWRGNLELMMTPKQKLTRGHHGALNYANIPNFMKQVRQANSISAVALEFTILTAARTSQTIEASLSEFDLENKVWTIPAHRMKRPREHRVPLCPRAVEIIESLIPIAKNMVRNHKQDPFVFYGTTKSGKLSNMAMEMCLRRILKQKPDEKKITVHGFRSSFRDWGYEETEFSREIIEAALAHKVGDDTEMAYKRGDALKRREKVMIAWADYCNSFID